MGSSQSSHAKYDVENFSVKKSSSSPSVRGRKSIYKGRFSAPHGLTASIVSIPSEHLRCLEDLDHDDDHDITAAETAHSDDVHLHEYQEELCDEETESESEEEEGKPKKIDFVARLKDLYVTQHFEPRGCIILQRRKRRRMKSGRSASASWKMLAS